MRNLIHKERRSAPPAWLIAVLLCTVVIALWCPSLHASFQFDDWNVIVNEPRVQSLAAWAASMPGIRPLLKLSYALNNTLSRAPFGFRAFNIAVHALNASLIAALFTRKGLQLQQSQTQARWAGLLTGLIFALHPVQTEAVTYISGRSSSFAALFSLLSLYAWARSDSNDDVHAQRKWNAVCCVTMLLAVAVKETALALPLLFWLWSASKPGAAMLPITLWPPLVFSAALLGIALSLPGYQRLLVFSLNLRPVSDNLLTQAHALLYLAGQLLRIDHINIDPQLAVVTQPDVFTLVLSGVWVALIAGSLWRLRKPSVGAFALLWFVICLLPTNTLLPRLDIANDRQLYLALAGPAWWLALATVQLHSIRPRVVYATLSVILVALACSTYQRNETYATEISFWQVAATQNPRSARAANNLGMAYAIACQTESAIYEFERAIALDPQGYQARINLKLLHADSLPGAPSARCQP